MTTYFDIIMIPLQLLIVFFTIYYFTLSFFGLVYRKKDKKVYEEKHTFAMVVCLPWLSARITKNALSALW